MKRPIALFLIALLLACQVMAPATAEMADSTVVIGISNDPERLGPFNSRSNGAKQILPIIYETLGARDEFSGTFYGVLMDTYQAVDEKTFDIKAYHG